MHLKRKVIKILKHLPYYIKRILSKHQEHLQCMYYNVSQCISREWSPTFQNIYYTTIYQKNSVQNSQYNKRIDSKILECFLLYYNVSQEYGVQNSRTVAILQCISSKWCPKFQNIYTCTTMSLKRMVSKIPEHLLLYYNVSQENNV